MEKKILRIFFFFLFFFPFDLASKLRVAPVSCSVSAHHSVNVHMPLGGGEKRRNGRCL